MFDEWKDFLIAHVYDRTPFNSLFSLNPASGVELEEDTIAKSGIATPFTSCVQNAKMAFLPFWVSPLSLYFLQISWRQGASP